MKKEIKEILEEFDFVKVNKVMEFLNWTWYGGDVPNIAKLILQASELLEEVYSEVEKTKEDSFRGTGGFEARGFYEKNKICLKLSFVLEDWDNFD